MSSTEKKRAHSDVPHPGRWRTEHHNKFSEYRWEPDGVAILQRNRAAGKYDRELTGTHLANKRGKTTEAETPYERIWALAESEEFVTLIGRLDAATGNPREGK